LSAPIDAGTWRLVGDGENLSQEVEVRFDIVWRVSSGGKSTDTILATTTHVFMPPPAGANVSASAFAAQLDGIAAPAKKGDELVYRFTVLSGAYYVPNGDGSRTGGAIPGLTLPTS
jgi:hypothetical protein